MKINFEEFVKNQSTYTFNKLIEIENLLGLLQDQILKVKNSDLSVDFVKLNTASVFMPMNDNLYNNFVPYENKFQSVSLYKPIDESNSLEFELIEHSDSPKYILYYILNHFFKKNYSVKFIDIGAWVGDVAIQLAVYSKSVGGNFHSQCFDPSYAGKFIPFNISVNNVSGFVKYEPYAVTVDGGVSVFGCRDGHTDSASITREIKNIEFNQLVISVGFRDLIGSVSKEFDNIFVKIDVEGIDAELVYSSLDLLKNVTIGIEFNPNQEQYLRFGKNGYEGAINFIEILSNTHTLFDLHYLPNPTCCCKIELYSEFVSNVINRPFCYTDILALPKNISDHDLLVDRLNKLKTHPPSLMLV